MKIGILYALLAAVLFGISTPFAKLLVASISPVLMLAGLLYGGSGLSLSVWMVPHAIPARKRENVAHLTRQDVPWLAGAVTAGGIAAPVFKLMFGITLIPASTASLLLNEPRRGIYGAVGMVRV